MTLLVNIACQHCLSTLLVNIACQHAMTSCKKAIKPFHTWWHCKSTLRVDLLALSLSYMMTLLVNMQWQARVQEPCELISLSLERVLSCEQEFKSLLSHLSLSHVSFELRDWLTRSLLGSHRRCSGAALSATLESANGKLFWRIIGTSCKHSSVFSWRCSSGQLGSVNKNSQEKSNFEAEMKVLRKNQTWKRKWKFYRKI